MSAARTALAFVAGLALGAAGAVVIGRAVERPNDSDEPKTTPDDEARRAPALAAKPGRPSTADAIPVAAPVRSAVATPPPVPPVPELLARFEEARKRGATAEAIAALDDALATGVDWYQTKEHLLRLSPAEIERWILRHRDRVGDEEVASVLLGAGRAAAGLDTVERVVASGEPISTELARRVLEFGGDRGFALLAGQPSRDDPNVGLVVADWLQRNGRAEEAVRRVVEETSRRTPTLDEIEWLSEHAPSAAVAAARTLSERRKSSPTALAALSRALERAGDLRGAFDALEAALRMGLSSDSSLELVRLDPTRSTDVLMELYGGRGDKDTTETLAIALLRAGRTNDAARELLRSALEHGSDSLPSIARIDAAAAVTALAREVGDVVAVPATAADRLLAYGVALRLVGRRDDAVRALRAAAEKQGRLAGPALVELLLADPVGSREFVESRLPGEDSRVTDRIRVLGLLGRRSEAVALFENARGDSDAYEALATFDPERAVRELRRLIAEEVSIGNEPDHLRASLATVLAGLGRTGEARAEWDRVSATDLFNLQYLLRRAAQR